MQPCVIFLLVCGLALAWGSDKKDIEYKVTEEVWFEIEAKDYDDKGNDFRGKVVFALFGEAAPITTMNFKFIAQGYKAGEKKFKLHYKNSPIHRIVPDFIIQMGDITVGDGTGGASIYGTRYNDEPFVLSHRAAGWVAMANHGADTNGSQFYILLQKARWLDGKHIVFGKVVKGFDVIKTIGEIETNPSTAVPKKKVMIVDSGVNKLDKPYILNEEELDDTRDL